MNFWKGKQFQRWSYIPSTLLVSISNGRCTTRQNCTVSQLPYVILGSCPGDVVNQCQCLKLNWLLNSSQGSFDLYSNICEYRSKLQHKDITLAVRDCLLLTEKRGKRLIFSFFFFLLSLFIVSINNSFNYFSQGCTYCKIFI